MLRIGHGYDVHRLTENRRLIIGGVVIPYEKGLLGHSDADVLLHAISDALLGAAALGDIGCLFPDNDEKYKGADSLVLLKEVVEVLKNKGYGIVNIDSTLIAQKPKMRPYIDGMKKKYCRSLRNFSRYGKCKGNHGRRHGLYRQRRRNGSPCSLSY